MLDIKQHMGAFKIIKKKNIKVFLNKEKNMNVENPGHFVHATVFQYLS